MATLAEQVPDESLPKTHPTWKCIKILLPAEPVTFSNSIDFALRPTARPHDPVGAYPIVGLARKAPIPYRRVQTDFVPFCAQLPSARLQWCNDFIATTAAAQMRRCLVFAGDIEDTILQRTWNEIDEPSLDMFNATHRCLHSTANCRRSCKCCTARAYYQNRTRAFFSIE